MYRMENDGMPGKTKGKIALLMAGIVAASAIMTLFTGVSHHKTGGIRVVASF